METYEELLEKALSLIYEAMDYISIASDELEYAWRTDTFNDDDMFNDKAYDLSCECDDIHSMCLDATTLIEQILGYLPED